MSEITDDNNQLKDDKPPTMMSPTIDEKPKDNTQNNVFGDTDQNKADENLDRKDNITNENIDCPKDVFQSVTHEAGKQAFDGNNKMDNLENTETGFRDDAKTINDDSQNKSQEHSVELDQDSDNEYKQSDFDITKLDSNIKNIMKEWNRNECNVFIVRNMPPNTLLVTKNALCKAVRLPPSKMYVFKKSINGVVQWYCQVENKSIAKAACKVLNGHIVLGSKLEAIMDVDNEFANRRERVKNNRFQKMPSPLNLPERMKVSWNSDPNETYGLSVQFLQSHGITPPLIPKIRVKNFPEDTSKDAMRDVFMFAGSIRAIKYSKWGPSFEIEYDHPVEAVQAISMFHNQTYFSRPLEVTMDKSKAARFRTVPSGMNGIGPGLGPDGDVLRGVRLHVELTQIQRRFEDIMRKLETVAEINKKEIHPPNLNKHSEERFSKPNPVTPHNVPNPINIPNPHNLPNANNQNQAALGSLGVLSALLNNQVTQVPGLQILQNLLQQNTANTLNTPNTPQQNVTPFLNNQQNDSALNAQQNFAQFPNTQFNASPFHKNQQNVPNQAANQPNFNPQLVSNAPNFNAPNTSSFGDSPHALPVQSNFLANTNTQNWSSNMGADYTSTMNQQYGNYDARQGFQPPSAIPSQEQNSAVWSKNKEKERFGFNPQSNFSNQSSKRSHDGSFAQSYTPEDSFKNDHHKQAKKKKEEESSEMLLFKNLPASVTWKALQSKMTELGEVKLCELTGEGRAIVRFVRPSDAMRCFNLYNNSKVDGRTITVNIV